MSPNPANIVVVAIIGRDPIIGLLCLALLILMTDSPLSSIIIVMFFTKFLSFLYPINFLIATVTAEKQAKTQVVPKTIG
jgi:hypothetical protein